MQLYILSGKEYAAQYGIEEYELIGVLDEQDDIVVNKRYNDVGYCAFMVACNEEMLELLKRGNYIFRFDDDAFFKIETMSIDTDVEQGDYITVDAIDMNNVLAGRIVRWDIVYSGKVAEFIKQLVTDNIINPQQAKRKIPNFIFDDSNFAEFTDLISVAKNTATQDLLQLVISTCKAYNYGFRVSFNIETRQLVFRLYKGKNKATMNGEEYVEFSPNFANIISSHYKEDESNYKNVVYIGYKSANKDDENVYLFSFFEGAEEPQGEDRREFYVDATNLNTDITLEELNLLFGWVRRSPETQGTETSGYYYITFSDGTTQTVATFEITTTDGKATEKLTVTDYTYSLLIRAAGANALTERVKTKEFNGEVDTIDTYKYKEDYDLGDIVNVANDYGLRAAAQITEITESENADSPYSVEPKFEYLN